MSDVTVIGLGNMGAALARGLMGAGRSVTVWNRSPERVGLLVAEGADRAASLEAAISASDIVLSCVSNQVATAEILGPVAGALAGKVVVDLSSGNAASSEALAKLVEGAGAGWVMGMINGYPDDIGGEGTAILCAGPAADWARVEGVVGQLGGASQKIGEAATAVAGLFAAMFTARQAFLFGLSYGAAVCRKAGLPVEALFRQNDVTLGMVRAYAEMCGRSVPGQRYDGSAAPLSNYLGALEDALATFEATGTDARLPRLMRDLAVRAVEEGLGDKELSVLTEMLAG